MDFNTHFPHLDGPQDRECSSDEEIDECGVCGGNGVTGDVNYDAAINVMDIILVLDYILDSNIYEINIC